MGEFTARRIRAFLRRASKLGGQKQKSTLRAALLCGLVLVESMATLG